MVSISLRSSLLAEVDRRAGGERSAFIEAAILARLRAARREATDRALRDYYEGRDETERSEEDRVVRDFAVSDSEAWRDLDKGR